MNKTWNEFSNISQNIDRWLEYFWSIRGITDIDCIISRFDYYFGSPSLVSDSVPTGVHHILKTSINEFIDSINLTKVLRDMNLGEII